MNGLELLALTQARSMMQPWDRPSERDWASVLATVPLFSGVSKRRLRKLARQATIAEFAAGDIVISKGERTDSLYIVLGGTAKARGRPAARALRTGDYFGELALIDGAPRSATVIAAQELHVMKLPGKSVRRLARRHPAITLTMFRNLSTQLRRLETQVARGA